MASNRLKTLVKNIQKILGELDRKPSWLADEAKVSRGTVSRILALEVNPSLDVIDALASALHVPPSRLIADDSNPIENLYTFDEVFEEKTKAVPETLKDIWKQGFNNQKGISDILRLLEERLATTSEKQSPEVSGPRKELIDLVGSISEDQVALILDTAKSLVAHTSLNQDKLSSTGTK